MSDQTFTVVVTGPCGAGITSLTESMPQTHGVSSNAGTDVLDDGEVGLVLLDTRGRPHSNVTTDSQPADVDIVAFVIDATAQITHAPAGVELRSLLTSSEVPVVLVVNRCDDRDTARSVARSLGASDGQSVIACQLDNPDSRRDVVVQVLTTLLEHIEGSDQVAAGSAARSCSHELDGAPHSWV